MIKDVIDIISNFKKTNYIFIIFASVFLILAEIISISIFLPLFYLLFDQENKYLNLLSKFLEKNEFVIIDIFTTFLLIVLIIYILRFFTSIILNFYILNYKASLQKFFSNKALDYFLKKKYLEIKKINLNRLQILTARETEKFANAVEALVILFTDFFVILLILGLLLLQEPYVSLIIIIFFSIFFGFYKVVFKPIIKKWGENHYFHDVRRTTTLNEIFLLIREIKIFGENKIFKQKYSFDNSRTQIAQRNRVYFFSFIKSFTEVLIVSLLTGGILIIHFQSKNLIDFLPIISFFFVATIKIYPLINRSMNNLQNLEFSRKSIEFHKKLSKFLKQKNKLKILKDNDQKIFKDKGKNILRLRNLYFSYDKKKIYKNLNINLQDNSIVGIQGESGGGKTTFVEILLGLIEPKKGEIRINNFDIHKNKEEWFKNISYVSQDNILFNGSILQNISFKLDYKDINKYEILNLLKNLNKNFYNKFKRKINSIINYNASNLSLGEKQRISIARGLFRGKKIIVLDEITSSLDKENEKQILNEVKKFKKDRLIIIISHKKSSLKICDIIYKIDNFRLRKVVNE